MKWIKSFLEKILQGGSCSFKENHGLDCPGCGASRAILKLFEGHILQSILYNPVVFMSIIVTIIFSVLHLYENKKWNGRHRYYRIRITCLIILIIVWTFFSFLRNFLLIHYGIDYIGDILY